MTAASIQTHTLTSTQPQYEMALGLSSYLLSLQLTTRFIEYSSSYLIDSSNAISIDVDSEYPNTTTSLSVVAALASDIKVMGLRVGLIQKQLLKQQLYHIMKHACQVLLS